MPSPALSPAPETLRSQRILLIDDDPFITQVVRRALADFGLEILEAADGILGFNRARREAPDLILLDLKMPGVDGFQVCAALKNDPCTAEIPVIIFSACDAIEEKCRGFQLGAVDYVTKPVAPDELVARLTVHLGQRRMYLNLLQRFEHYREQVEDEDAAEASAELPERRLARLAQAKELLERSLDNPPTLEALARQVGTNAKRLSKDFQILHGMTAFAWLREQRLHQAARMLRTTDFTVGEIALHLGFSSGPNLSTLFKGRFQATPRQYRLGSRPSATPLAGSPAE